MLPKHDFCVFFYSFWFFLHIFPFISYGIAFGFYRTMLLPISLSLDFLISLFSSQCLCSHYCLCAAKNNHVNSIPVLLVDECSWAVLFVHFLHFLIAHFSKRRKKIIWFYVYSFITRTLNISMITLSIFFPQLEWVKKENKRKFVKLPGDEGKKNRICN